MSEQLLEQISNKINSIEVFMNELHINQYSKRNAWWKDEIFLKWIYKISLASGIICTLGVMFITFLSVIVDRVIR